MKNKLGFGFYHLDPRWCTFEEFDDMIDRGFINSSIISMDSYGTLYGAAEKMKEIGGEVWIGTQLFYSKKEKLSEYMERMKRLANNLKERELWDVVSGFHWDEPILHRGHTNEDYLAMTKALYEEFGKRNFPVFSTYEVIGKKGNWDDPEGTLILESDATKYTTDAGFDSYGYDFRLPVNDTLKGVLDDYAKEHPEIDSVKNYYRFYFNRLKKTLQNKDAKIWVFPTSYRTSTWAGYPSDEDYCIAHLEGLKEILLEQENPGGIMCYTYKTWGTLAMDRYFDKNGPEYWSKFEEACKKIAKELNVRG